MRRTGPAIAVFEARGRPVSWQRGYRVAAAGQQL